MEYLKKVFNSETYNVVDIENKCKYIVKDYLNFYKNIKPPYYLAEIPLFPSPVLVDVDIKKKGDNVEKLYDEFVVEEIILSYTKILQENLVCAPNEFKIIFLSKPPRKVGDYIKHGFHLHFTNVFLQKDDLKRIYELAKQESEFGEYLDDVTTKPWLMYKASKSSNELFYEIEKGYIVKNDDEVIEVDYKSFFYGEKFLDIVIDENNLQDFIVGLMSIRSCTDFLKNKVFELTPETFKILNDLPIETSKKHLNISDEKIADLVYLLSSEKADDYYSWITIGMILVSVSKIRNNSEFFKGLFHVFSQKSDKYDEYTVDNKWNSLYKINKENGVGIGTLIYMVKEDNNVQDIKDLLLTVNTVKIPSADYEITKLVRENITELYMTHKNYGCFTFKNTVWVEVKSWENVFKNYISEWGQYYLKKLYEKITNEEDNLKKLKAYYTLYKKINNYTSRTNLCKALFDDYFNNNVEKLFQINKTKLAFTNIVLDIPTLTLVSGNPKDYLSTYIKHDLVLWKDVSTNVKNFIKDFYEKLFPDEELRFYAKTNFARFLTGNNVFKHFQVWTGSGNNGKSALVSLFQNMLKSHIVKLPKASIMGETTKQGAAFPEICRLKNALMAIIDELTVNDIVDPGQIKKFSGKDTLYARDLFQKGSESEEIDPLFVPILVLNDPPIIKHPDQPTWDRFRIIKFEAKFTDDVELFKIKNPEEKYVYYKDPKIDELLKEYAPYFLSELVDILIREESLEKFNEKEVVPIKAIEGFENFKQGQNVLKKYIDENFIIVDNGDFSIKIQKFLKEFNYSKPKINLNIEEVKAALINYSEIHPKVHYNIETETITGLCRID